VAKRISIWAGFIIIIGLVVWGLIAAENKSIVKDQSTILLTPVSSADWITGSTTAPIQIVEYADFQCPACGAYYPILKQLTDEEGSKFSLVYRHFPLPQHQNAYPSAIAAEAAGKQGKFWEMHDLIFQHQTDWENAADPSSIYTGYAKTLGLSLDKFATDSADPALRTKIEASLKEGEKAGIDATPTFFVNGKKIMNPHSYDEFKAIVNVASSTNK
jgi:protein-disulfide isomerase